MRTAKRVVLWPIAALLAATLLYFLAAWVGSSIPRNSGWTEPSTGVEIMVEDNGVHTAIIMPLVSEQVDWRAHFPLTDLARPDAGYTHVSVSWGEHNVFLNTPTWADLSLSTALGAATGGDVLTHAAFYVRPAASPSHRRLTISEETYARLVEAVLKRSQTGGEKRALPGYAAYDAFYPAPGTYHLGNTCNQFVSDALAEAGIRTGWWTPMAGGVMKWVPLPPE
ncbi:DUF2459 domain-containing protein [Erythrobacter sp. HKB08]|uniref:DUF2459 domain-containing protein n=1 Tax=Erythrobacter sp. HKB08 TaxID=2502843 RepID=UPI0010093A12|nr:DUF2459 domain-containing protein [Erythrobacter sp. HKB08]